MSEGCKFLMSPQFTTVASPDFKEILVDTLTMIILSTNLVCMARWKLWVGNTDVSKIHHDTCDTPLTINRL